MQPTCLHMGRQLCKLKVGQHHSSLCDQSRRGNNVTTCLCFAGESGLGKSTLINSLFLTDLYNAEHPGPFQRATAGKTLKVSVRSSISYLLME